MQVKKQKQTENLQDQMQHSCGSRRRHYFATDYLGFPSPQDFTTFMFLYPGRGSLRLAIINAPVNPLFGNW